MGFEEIYRMYPIDFEEFLWANGVQDTTIQYLKTCMDAKAPVLPAVHETMTKLFYSYIVVGGMPDVVQTYVDTHDIGKVIGVQTSLLELYRQDIARYAEGSEKVKIQAIFDAIPSQLNDKNRRFMVNSLRLPPGLPGMRIASSGSVTQGWRCLATMSPSLKHR